MEFFKNYNKLPTPTQLVDAALFTKTAPAASFLKAFIEEHVVTMIITPNGKVFSNKGDTVWVKTTRGSLMPARYKFNGDLGGHIIES